MSPSGTRGTQHQRLLAALLARKRQILPGVASQAGQGAAEPHAAGAALACAAPEAAR